jgi:putative transposase
MKKSRFSESQIIRILKEADGGRKVVDICREHGVSQATYYQWKAKFGGMETSDIRRLKELEEENSKLKRMFAMEIGVTEIGVKSRVDLIFP